MVPKASLSLFGVSLVGTGNWWVGEGSRLRGDRQSRQLRRQKTGENIADANFRQQSADWISLTAESTDTSLNTPKNPTMANLDAVYQGEVLGKRVKILFTHDGSPKKHKFYPGTVMEARSYLDEKGFLIAEHLISFDDGDELWFDLRWQEQEDKLRWVDAAKKPTKSRKKPSSRAVQTGRTDKKKKAKGTKRGPIVEGIPRVVSPEKRMKTEDDTDEHAKMAAGNIFDDDDDDASFLTAVEYL